MTASSVRLIMPKTDIEVLRERVAALQTLGVLTQPMGNRVLVAKLIRSTVGTSGRLLASEITQKEDRWQGKVGLVVAVGPLAFEDDAANDFRGQTVEPGQFVLFNYGDGSDFDVKMPDGETLHLKMIKDVEIHDIVLRPDLIY